MTTLEGYHDYIGGGGVQYIGGCSAHRSLQ